MLDRINPYWKLTLVFKCLSDNIMLDDFKTELRRLGNGAHRLNPDFQQRTEVPEGSCVDGDVMKLSTSQAHVEFP